MADAFFRFLGINSYLTTPFTSDLNVSNIDVEVDISTVDWNQSQGVIMYVGLDASAGGYGIALAGERVVMRYCRDIVGGFATSRSSELMTHVSNSRHTIRATYDSATFRFLTDGAEINNVASVEPLIPANSDVIIGDPNVILNLSGRFNGEVFSTQISDPIGGAVILKMDANDAGFSSGRLTDGQTFSSGGRVFTVRGPDVYFTEATQTFELEATAALNFVGSFVPPHEGSFGLTAEADTQFDGVELPLLETSFGLSGEAALEFDGVVFFTGNFGLSAESDVEFSGEGWVERVFALVGSAELGFTGQAEMHGTFALEGEADVQMFWLPTFCPGTSAAGCARNPASVTDTMYPASACLCGRSDC